MADNGKLMYGKKEVKLSKIDNSSLFAWFPTSGGELPMALRGKYTSTAEALKGLRLAQNRLAAKAPASKSAK